MIKIPLLRPLAAKADARPVPKEETPEIPGPDPLSLSSYMESDEFEVVLAECNLHIVAMDGEWDLIFSKKFTLFFGTDRQPITGILLAVQRDTGRFYLTVFSRVCVFFLLTI